MSKPDTTARIHGGSATIKITFEPERTYIVRSGAIWLEPGAAITPGWLVIENGRITKVSRGPEAPLMDVEFLDLEEYFIAPGLIDAHVHLGLDRSMSLSESLEQAARAGLAGVRDGGDREGRVLRNRKRIEAEIILSASGKAIFRQGRYGGFLGRPIKDEGEIDGIVRELADQGADHVKVLASGPVLLDGYGRVGPPQFEKKILKRLVRCARDHGLPVMSHANGREAVLRCIQAGVDSIEHGFFMGRDCLRMIADQGLAWIPTVQAFAALADTVETAERKEIIERTIHEQIEQMISARSLGVRLGLGTDAGSPGVKIGRSVREEISWWLEAGFSGEEILAAATTGNAEIIGKESELGRFAPGLQAFFIGFPKTASLESNLLQAPLIIGRPRLEK